MTRTTWFEGFLSSLSVILVSEIGDKTFFIACLLAMRHAKWKVYVGALSAVSLMTVLAVLMGMVAPSVLSVRVTQILSATLFLSFGVKILWDELIKRSGSGQCDDDEDEIAEAAAALRSTADSEAVEMGASAPRNSFKFFSRAITKAWQHSVVAEAFMLTFIAEWGDRSQISTIALAASSNPYAVTLGGITGHAICTGCAVLGGTFVAHKISVRMVNITGGALFLVFGLVSLLEFMFT